MSSPVNFGHLQVTIAVAGVAQRVSVNQIRCYKFEAHILSANTGPVYIGDSSITTTGVPRAKASSSGAKDGTYEFIASEEASFAHGEWFDLKEIYVLSGTAGDKVSIQYIRAGV